MRIATLNVQNLRLRTGTGAPRLDGARDGNLPADDTPSAAALDERDRRLTARLLAAVDADVVALQEVFDRETLDHFHDAFLRPAGLRPYPARVCLPGNDGRGLDVALMSRLPIDRVVSHADLFARDVGLGAECDDGLPVFRRDCLEAEIAGLTLFVCHFKAPHPDPDAAWQIRRCEALAVRRLVERRFGSGAMRRWMILGDLNEPPIPSPARAPAIAPLVDGFARDLMERLPQGERWSYLDPGSGRYSRPDAILFSPDLARACPEARPAIVRIGMSREVARYEGRRLAGVGEHRPHASDHAALVVDLGPGGGAPPSLLGA